MSLYFVQYQNIFYTVDNSLTCKERKLVLNTKTKIRNTSVY